MGSLLTKEEGGGVLARRGKICTSKSTFHKSSQEEGGELGKQGRELGKRRRCRLGERKVV